LFVNGSVATAFVVDSSTSVRTATEDNVIAASGAVGDVAGNNAVKPTVVISRSFEANWPIASVNELTADAWP
jgi:hypothetical protein